MPAYPNNHNVRMTCPISPSHTVNPRPIYKLAEYPARTLVSRRPRQDGNDQRCGSHCMPPNRNIVQVVQDFNAKCVRQALREEDGGVDACEFDPM